MKSGLHIYGKTFFDSIANFVFEGYVKVTYSDVAEAPTNTGRTRGLKS